MLLPGIPNIFSLTQIILRCFLHVHQKGVHIKENSLWFGEGLDLFFLHIRLNPQNSGLRFRNECLLLTVGFLIVSVHLTFQLPETSDMSMCRQEPSNSTKGILTPGPGSLVEHRCFLPALHQASVMASA